jgi:hypothetical protein
MSFSRRWRKWRGEKGKEGRACKHLSVKQVPDNLATSSDRKKKMRCTVSINLHFDGKKHDEKRLTEV